MAKVNLSYTKPEITGDASFYRLRMNFDSMMADMKIFYEGIGKNGLTDITTTYNSLTTEEKPTALKFIKMLIVNIFNQAMDTEYTWDQVPNSIFVTE